MKKNGLDIDSELNVCRFCWKEFPAADSCWALKRGRYQARLPNWFHNQMYGPLNYHFGRLVVLLSRGMQRASVIDLYITIYIDTVYIYIHIEPLYMYINIYITSCCVVEFLICSLLGPTQIRPDRPSFFWDTAGAMAGYWSSQAAPNPRMGRRWGGGRWTGAKWENLRCF